MKFLKSKKILTTIYYPKPIHLQKPYKKFPKSNNLKNSQLLSKCSFSIPIDPYLLKTETKYIVESINKFFKKN